jgi:DNA-binding MarR family transcriptional regulator
VEWGPVLAGAFLAAALSFVLLTFGAAIGLSATSPWPNSGISTRVLASIAIFYLMAQQIGSLMIGGYVAGRMRGRWHEITEHEVEFRDGLHGALVWAVGVVISALLAMSVAGSVAQKAADIAGRTTASAAASSGGAAMDTVIDALLRPAAATAPSTPPGPAAGGTPPTQPRARAANPESNEEVRAEIGRIMASSVATGMTEQNRTYLAQLVAQRTGVPQQEAEKRVREAEAAAREAADKARRAAVLTGFVTAAGLLLSLGAAWWAAMRGGNHRDNAVPARFAFDRRRGISPTPWEEETVFRDIILWLAGVPIVVIILLHLVGALHWEIDLCCAVKGSRMSGKRELSSPLLLIHLVSREADKLFAQHTAERSPSSREYAVLEAVANADGLNQTAIMTATGLDRSSTADVVRRMVAKGLLRRRRTRRDIRQYAVRLTPTGEELCRIGQAAARAVEEDLFARLTRTQKDTFAATLRTLANLTEQSTAT